MKSALLASDVTAPGGVDTYILDVVREARAGGWTVRALLDDAPGADGLAQALAPMCDMVERASLHPKRSPAKAARGAVEAAIRRARPGVVFVVCPAPWLGVAAREAAISRGIPLVFVEQFVEPGIVFAPGVRERIVKTYRRAAAAVAVGRSNVQVLRGYGFPAERMTVIPNSVRVDEPVERFRREEVFRRFAIPERACNAVAVARLHRHKGLDVLIEAVATLDAADRGRFHVVVFGEGEARSDLESAIRRYALTDHIRLAGWYGRPREVIGAFDLFILPSRNEGLPFAVLEAMAEGLPVITSDAGSAHEAVGDEQGGLVVPRENAPALRDALSRMIRDGEFRRNCGRVARENVRDYDAAANLRRLIDLWDAAYRSPYQDS